MQDIWTRNIRGVLPGDGVMANCRLFGENNKMKSLLVKTVLALLLFTSTVIAADLSPAENQPKPAGPDPAKLVGRWMRPDGGYILQLSDPSPDGPLKAEYFNPRPINVAQSEWKYQEGYLVVFIELRAPNYPGSTYTLVYEPARDLLVGIYYQAALQQQFEVGFARVP
jgi:hypothetical protein